MKHKNVRLWVALIALNLMNFAQVVEAATITPATSPLANISGDVVRPNILYVLDNSGSMRWDYLPDYVSDGTSTTGSQICWNGTNDTNSLSTCRTGTTASPTDSNDMITSAVEVPVTTSDINYIYYNPATYYQLPIKADGTTYPNSTVTAAYTDGFALSGSTNLKNGSTVTSTLNCTPNGSTTVTCAAGTEGLKGTFVTNGTGVPSGAYVTAVATAAPFTTLTLSAAATGSTASNWTFKTGAYPHQVYCNTGSPTAQNLRGNGTVCKETTDTVTLGSTDLYPSSTFSTAKSYDGAPYYYSMSPMEYCTNSFFTSCQATSGGAFTVPALYRWCTSNAYTDCVDLRNSTHTVPDYLGTFPPAVAAVQATASLTVNSYIVGKSITALNVNGVNIIAAGSLPIVAGTTGNTTKLGIATTICTAINAYSITSGYDCPSVAVDTVTIRAKAPPAHADYETPNLPYLVQIPNAPAVTTGTAASATLTLDSIPGITKVDDITVGATSLLTAPQKTTLAAGFADGTNTTANATTLAGMIAANSGVSGYTACAGTACSPAIATNQIKVTRTTVGVITSALALTGTGVRATGTITVGTTGQTSSTPADLGGISVGATSIVGHLDSTDITNGTANNTNATTIDNAIGSSYTATTTGSVVTVTAPTVGSTLNGTNFTFVAGTAVAPTADVYPTGLITFGGTTTSATLAARINRDLPSSRTITVGSGGSTITVSTANPLTITGGNSRTPAQVASAVVASVGTGGTVKAYIGGTPTSASVPATCTSQTNRVVCLVDTSGTITNGKTVAVGSRTNFSGVTVAMTATAGGAAGTPGVTNFAPALSGIAFSGGKSAQTATGSSLGGGVAETGPIDTNATSPATRPMAGGVNPSGGSRLNVGKFTRVDIVPSTATYPKASGRTDCVGASCTYAEELQNFANWYSFYRSRMLLMKTTSTLAFDELDSKYRVGFDLLSHYGSNSINVEISQFVDSGGETANQRTTWWSNLTTADGSSGTPLRSALLKAGKYYGGKLTSSAAIPAIAETPAKGYLDISSSTSDGATITTVKVEGVEILGSTFTVSGCAGSCNGTERTAVATNLANAIAAHIASLAYTSILTNPHYVISSTSYTSGGSTVGRVVITAPAAVAPALATDYNGADLTASKTGTLNLGVIDFTSGVDATPAVPAAVVEPVQYSCQQNFTLLVTDGYWNTDSYTNLTKLGGTALTNEDNTNTGYTTRPSYDGVVASTTCTDSAVSSCGTLADIAMYYYETDIRDASLSNEISGDTGLDVATNNVFKSPTDDNQQQHMVLFTMALGAPGTLRYRSDYPDATSGDFYDISTTNANPLLQKNWPAVKANDPSTIDDLWHAAANGRGKYFSARDPQSVVDGLTEALASVQVREGAAAAAATSNLQPIAGDNFAYVASYTTNEWSGDLQARLIDTVTGAVSEPVNAAPNDCVGDSGCPWSAQKKLESKVWSARKIYMAPTSGSTLRAFNLANLTPTELAFFDPSVGNVVYGTGPLSQYASVYATNPTEITDAKMIDFLRGDTSLEVANLGSLPEVWRDRKHVLGDIVNTQPTFVKKTVSTTYEDSGYSAFITAQASREGVVYVSGNDGMLHAFASDDFFDGTASGGEELWAYIPTQALPYLRYLADTNYVHRYFVDGPIAVSDVNFGGGASDWHTVLVAGLGSGGNAYFALDITDPVNPVFLWEFTDANLGLTYGNPSMNKLPNGQWAVLFSSGYNNADGEGYLYAVDVETGVLKTGYPLTTNSGTAASPSNLGKIAAWVDNLTINNTVTDVYAGDMDGDLWRFDLTTNAVSRVAHLTDSAANAQPITTRPELTLVDGNRVIYVGTGRYLGLTDPADLSVQSFYAIKDTSSSPSPDWSPRLDTGTINGVPGTPMFIQRKLIALKNDGSQITRVAASGNTVDARQICTGIGSEVDSSTGDCINETGGTIDWAQYGGWYFDLPDSGERMNVDMNLTLGTLTIPSNVPASSACTSGGYGWVNYVDFKTGLEVDTATMIVSEKIANALIVGLNVIKVGDKLVAIVTTSDFNHDVAEPPGTPGQFKGKRDLWRELDPY